MLIPLQYDGVKMYICVPKNHEEAARMNMQANCNYLMSHRLQLHWISATCIGSSINGSNVCD